MVNQRRRPPRRRPNQQQRNRSVRLPKSITAIAPFRVASNRQLTSVPNHGEGLTVSRKIRLRPLSSSSPVMVTYQQIFTRFFEEIGVNMPITSEATFTPSRVDLFATAVNSATSSGSIVNLRIFTEPEPSLTLTTATNAPYFEAGDIACNAGLTHVAAIIPKGATYTMASDDRSDFLALPFVSIDHVGAGFIVCDITATYTVKQVLGSSLIREMRALQTDDPFANQE